jgi:hypothetical protein
MMLGIVNFIMDTAEARQTVRHLVGAVPPGSYLTISHPTTEVDAAPMIQAVEYRNQQGSALMTLRTREEILTFFDGIVERGVVTCSRWRLDPTEVGEIIDVNSLRWCRAQGLTPEREAAARCRPANVTNQHRARTARRRPASRAGPSLPPAATRWPWPAPPRRLVSARWPRRPVA